MNKKILLIDLDGVCCDFGGGIKKLSPDTDVSKWSKEVDDICEANPTIFHNLEPIEGAIESITKLSEHYDIYFLSTPMWNVPESFTGKRIWIEKHFGEIGYKRLILSHRKDLVIGDFLIDDTFRHGADEFKGEHIHFGHGNFTDWKNVLDYLLRINSIYNTLTQDMGVSNRAKKCLRIANIDSIGDLVKFSELDLLRCRNCGWGIIHEITAYLKPLGIQLK